MFRALRNRSRQLTKSGRETQKVTKEVAEDIKNAYLQHRDALDRAKGKFPNYLAYMRQQYSDLLKEVLALDRELLAKNTIPGPGLGTQLMQAGKFNVMHPFTSDRSAAGGGSIDWGKRTHLTGKRKGEKDRVFSPRKKEWTNVRGVDRGQIPPVDVPDTRNGGLPKYIWVPRLVYVPYTAQAGV